MAVSNDSSYKAEEVSLESLSVDVKEEKPTNCTAVVRQFVTIDEASSEFGAVVADIAEELENYTNKNINKIKLVCLHLKTNENMPILNEEETQCIRTSKSIYDIFSIMEPYWNWSSHRLLYTIIKRVNAPKAIEMLDKFENKINYQVKLKYVHEHFKMNRTSPPVGYYKMTAIINKDYSEITLEEGLEIEKFVSDCLGVEQSYNDVVESQSIEMTWYIPDDAVESLCSKAFQHKESFILQSFVFLKIGNTIIFDECHMLNAKIKDISLHDAAEKGEVEVIERLISSGADINAIDEDGRTPLHIVSKNGFAQLVEILMKSNANINVSDKEKWTPLLFAAEHHHIQIAEILMKAGVDVNVQQKNGWAPLHAAVHNNEVQLAEMLIKFGANVNIVTEDGWTPLHDAAHIGHPEVVETLIRSKADINVAIHNGWTPLHAATYWNHAKVVDVLIKSGANVNVTQNEDGWTPLHCASRCGNVEIVEMLITAGSTINAINKGGDLPLHIASSNGHVEVVKVLVKAGADMYLANNKNRSALQEAVDCKQGNVVHYLVNEAEANIRKLDQVTQIKIRKLLKEIKPVRRKSLGQLADEYDSDQSSGAHSSASSGHESDFTDEE